jgi:hypothetical protein
MVKSKKPVFFKNTKEDIQYVQEENYEFNDIFRKVCEYIGKETTTDSYNLQQTAVQFLGTKKFKGVFPYDLCPKMKNGQSVILNTDKHSEAGQHWIALYKKSQKQYYFFDSYGREWERVIPDLKIRVLGNNCDVASCSTVRQFGLQTFCGQMSLSFLIYLYQQPRPQMALVI